MGYISFMWCTSMLFWRWAVLKRMKNYEWHTGNNQLWKPSFSSKPRIAVQSHISQYLGWVYATQHRRTAAMEQAGHKMHHMHSLWAGKAQHRHSTCEEGEQLHDVNWTVAWLLEGSDTQTPAVLTLHSTYKCINLSLVISNIQHLTTLGLILNKTCTLFTCI